MRYNEYLSHLYWNGLYIIRRFCELIFKLMIFDGFIKNIKIKFTHNIAAAVLNAFHRVKLEELNFET